jgi:hypothetical protein
MIKKLLTASFAATLISLGGVAPTNNSAIAQPPDFSVCAGLTGAALGLCRGAVAAGCADGGGNPTACMTLADNFRSTTGDEPPWLAPPITCPCDYYADVPITSGWLTTPLAVFACPGDTAYFQGIPSTVPQLPVVNAIRTTEMPPKPICQSVDADGNGNVREITEEELAVCRANVIAYGQAVMVANPALAVTDTCTSP